jgi:hypothetical protein
MGKEEGLVFIIIVVTAIIANTVKIEIKRNYLKTGK